MSEITANPGLAQTQIARLMKYALQALILLPVIAGFLAYRAWTTQPAASIQAMTEAMPQAATTTISAKTLEERFGVRVALIAVTGGGGIVDFRYRIIDKEKARFLLDDPHNAPTLIVEGSGIKLVPPGHTMKHSERLENDKTYFSFYPNTQNAVKPGTRVSVLIGSMRLEPIVAH